MSLGLVAGLRSRARSVFYGWWVTVAGALMNALSSGFFDTGFTVYFLPISRDLNISRTSTSLIFGLTRLEGGIQGPITGYCIDRWGPRVMLVIGAVLAGIGFMLLPVSRNFAVFLLVYVGIISVGIHTGFGSAVMAAVARWFVRRRGTAFGVISLGWSLGSAVVTPLVAVMVLNLGWRWAALISGIVILLVGIPLSRLIRGSPEEVGQLPDGVRPVAQGVGGTLPQYAPTEGKDYTALEAFRTPLYWLLAVGISLRIAVHAGVMVHLVPLMVWKGMGEGTGGSIVGLIAFFGLATRMGMGWWGDRWSKQWLTALAMLVGAGSLLLLLFSGGQLWQIVLFAILFSVTDGAAGLTWAMVGDHFGRRAFATLRGWMDPVISLGSLATPVFAGWVFDTTKSYYWALLPFAGLYAATALLFLFLPRSRP